jgi:hypothetical protein
MNIEHAMDMRQVAFAKEERERRGLPEHVVLASDRMENLNIDDIMRRQAVLRELAGGVEF